MPAKEFAPSQVIIESGQPLTHLMLIAEGSVKVSFCGLEYVIGKGDVIGINDFLHDSNFFTYQAIEKTVVLPYPYEKDKMTVSWFKSNLDLSSLYCLSAGRQICNMLDQYELNKFDCDTLFKYLQSSYTEYTKLCHKHNVTPRVLPDLEQMKPLSLEEDVDDWCSDYYTSLRQNMTDKRYSAGFKNAGFLCGFLYKASADIHGVLSICEEMSEYRASLSSLLLNTNQLDFYDLYTSLYFRLGSSCEDSDTIAAAIGKLAIHIEGLVEISPSLFEERESAYKKKLATMEESGENSEADLEISQLKDSVADSMNIILEYGGCLDSIAAPFRESVNAYKKLADKTALDDNARKLRRDLTKQFYEIYASVLQVSLAEDKVPTVIKMFLNFGYVDEDLAGLENACYLYQLASQLKSDPENGVYTLFDWFQAIYHGEKEPSRNEFDMDYNEHLHDLKISGKISAETETKMSADKAQKVMYEVENMFPLVNKMTYGRISTFCPLFSEHNIIRTLSEVLVTPEKVQKCINTIKSIDFSAYYRETIYSNQEQKVGKEFIHVEVLPNIILMPNIGVRGVTWQEIEGKRRTTPCRMMLPIFSLENIDSLLIRLTGEFRWEMCKRIQGARWNDVSERSLTSEYSDYIQFYRKNNDLSSDAKDKIKISLQKAKNSFKEMFVRDYETWIQFEGKGSPRLNKVARVILFTYCPFPSQVRNSLKVNPMYSDLLGRYDIRLAQKVHHISGVISKISSCGQVVPDEILQEEKFISK